MNNPKQSLDTSHVPGMTSACLSMDYHTPGHFSIEEALSLASSVLSVDEYTSEQLH